MTKLIIDYSQGEIFCTLILLRYYWQSLRKKGRQKGVKKGRSVGTKDGMAWFT